MIAPVEGLEARVSRIECYIEAQNQFQQQMIELTSAAAGANARYAELRASLDATGNEIEDAYRECLNSGYRSVAASAQMVQQLNAIWQR